MKQTLRDQLEMSDGCLSMIHDKLSSLMDMTATPPMFYPEAIHTLYVRAVRAARDCEREHKSHDGNEQAWGLCLMEKVRAQDKATKGAGT